MLRNLALMAKFDSKLESLLTQRAFATLRKFRNLDDGRLRFRMSAQLFHIRFGIFTTHNRLLLCFLSHLLFLNCESALLLKICVLSTGTADANTAARAVLYV